MPSYSPVFSKGKPRVCLPIVIWFGVDAHLDSTRNTWDFLQRRGTLPHFLWNPSTGDVVEGVPLDHSGTMLRDSQGVTVAVICDPLNPFTDIPSMKGYLEGAEILAETFKALGVPDIWPLGPPSPREHPRAIQRPLWPGHYSADQIDSRLQGIGAIDVRRLHGSYAA